MSGFKQVMLPVLVDSNGSVIGFKELDGDETMIPRYSPDLTALLKPDGTALAGQGAGYVLPVATASTLGGVKAGTGVTIGGDGTLTATGAGGGSAATDIVFATAVPLTNTAGAYMPTKIVTAPLAFSPAAGTVRGAFTMLQIVHDGVSAITFPGFTELSASSGIDTRANYQTIIQFSNLYGVNYWAGYSAANAVSVPVAATGVSLTGPSVGVVNTASSAFTVAFSPAGGTNAGSVTVTPTPVAGITFNPASVALTTGQTQVFTATSSTTGAKTIAITNNGGLANPASITWTVAAAAVVPAAPTIGTAVAGNGYVDVAFTRNSDGGSSVLDSTATLSTGQTGTGASSPIRVVAPNGTAVTATVKDRNSVGSSAASAASNSVTPIGAVVPAQYPRIAGAQGGESGTGPYSYTANSSRYYNVFNTPSLVGDGYFIARQEAYQQIAIGMHNAATPVSSDYSQNPPYIEWAVWTGTGNWVPSTHYVGQAPANTVGMDNSGVATNGDWCRFKRTGTTLVVDISKDKGVTWTVVYTWTGVTGTIYPNIGANIPFTLMGAEGLS